MDVFKTNIYNIYNLINDDKNESSLVNTKIISKQYLAYYIYRIIDEIGHLVTSLSRLKQIDSSSITISLEETLIRPEKFISSNFFKYKTRVCVETGLNQTSEKL